MGFMRIEGPRLEGFSKQVLDHVILAPASKAAGERGVKYIREELSRAGINDNGDLGRSFKSNTSYTPLGPLISIYSDITMTGGKPVAVWVNDGTGIYNDGSGIGTPGSGQPITPKNSRVLRFNPAKRNSAVGRRGVFNSPTSGQFVSAYVYAPSVRGQKPTHFMENALRRIKVAAFFV
jgi:hypothetical protein